MATGIRRSVLDFSDPVTRERVMQEIMVIVGQSFEVWPMRHVTSQEQKNRTELLYEGYKHCRDELGYSVTRSLDILPRFLWAALDKDAAPIRQKAERNSWFANA